MTRLSDERIAEIKAVEESLRGDKVFGARGRALLLDEIEQLEKDQGDYAEDNRLLRDNLTKAETGNAALKAEVERLVKAAVLMANDIAVLHYSKVLHEARNFSDIHVARLSTGKTVLKIYGLKDISDRTKELQNDF